MFLESGFELAEELSFQNTFDVLRTSVDLVDQNELIDPLLVRDIRDGLRLAESAVKAGQAASAIDRIGDVHNVIVELAAGDLIPEEFTLVTLRGLQSLAANIEANLENIVGIEVLKVELEVLAGLGQISEKNWKEIQDRLNKAIQNLRLGKDLFAMELLGDVAAILETEIVTDKIQIQLLQIKDLVFSIK